ncbi:MAG: sodium:solute symporter family protein [Balneolales bacterium]
MQQLDWAVLVLFFLVMIIIGTWSYKKVGSSADFFIAGGKLPWWLSGISHHISGYSGAVFVAYAAIAYTHGFTIYIWWSFMIAISVFTGAFLIAPRWSRLRSRLNIESPTEFLKTRYNLPTQQVMAWSGVLLKLFDVGAKWAAIAILLNVFTDVSLTMGILLAGGVSLVYITVGGLWADVWTDLAQFVVQIVAGFVMFFIVIDILGGFNSLVTVWDQLPEANSQLFNEPYTGAFTLAFLFIFMFSYNGGTWNLATRYISSPSGSDARKAAILSAVLYLVWPLILFFPMWAAPVLLPGLENPEQSYALLTMELLPPGLVGLVVASMFANTMSMTSSDANTISAVITRDILPNLSNKFTNLKREQSLFLARLSTFIFTALTLLIAINADSFGGVLGLIITWFGALVGPVSVPMLLGLLPAFRNSDSRAAITSILGGLGGFVIVTYMMETSQAVQVASPLAISLFLFIGIGLLSRNKEVAPEVDNLLDNLSQDELSNHKEESISERKNS